MSCEEVKENRESPRGRSQLSLYAGCPRKWAWKYVKGFKSIELVNHLVHGSAVHEAQEVFYLSFDKGLDIAVGAMYDRLEAYIESQDPEGKHPTFYKEQLDRARETLDVWYTEIGQYDFHNSEVLAVEEEVNLTLLNGYKMTIRFDRILKDKETGRIFINDTKTTGGTLDKTIANYMFADQPILYQAAFLENYPDWVEAFEGWRTDAIETRLLKSGWKKNARRSAVTRTPDAKIEDCIINYTALVDNIRDSLYAVSQGESLQSAFPGNNGNCQAYGRLCAYHSFCHEIDTLKEPPGNMKIDDWLAKGTVLNSFKEIISEEEI